MKNLIILYNPYYQDDVIEQHLKVLIENEKVALIMEIKLEIFLTKINHYNKIHSIYKG